MAIVTNYSTLETEVARILNRTDLATDVPNFIQRAMASLRRDERARMLVDLSPLDVSTEATDLPSDIDSLYSVAHDGPTYFGPLALTDLGGLTKYKALLSITTGVPAACAIRRDGAGNVQLMVAPEPNATFSLQAQYWAKPAEISSTNPTSVFLTNEPDIVIYGALVESAPFLKDDDRIGMWEQQLEKRLERMGRAQKRLAFSGEMVDPPRRVF
jgi:hypothetical protein